MAVLMREGMSTGEGVAGLGGYRLEVLDRDDGQRSAQTRVAVQERNKESHLPKPSPPNQTVLAERL